MKIEKRIYKIVMRGKRFDFPVVVSLGFKIREKIFISSSEERVENSDFTRLPSEDEL